MLPALALEMHWLEVPVLAAEPWFVGYDCCSNHLRFWELEGKHPVVASSPSCTKGSTWERCDHYPGWKRPRLGLDELVLGRPAWHAFFWWVWRDARTLVPAPGPSCDALTPPAFALWSATTVHVSRTTRRSTISEDP